MSTPANSPYLQNITAILATPVVKQLIFLLSLAGSVALGIVMYTSIREPVYRPLDYQVNAQNMSAMVDTLDKAGIKYKINDQDGLLYVDSKDTQMARMKLASAGIAKDDSFNFSFLNDKSNLGNSQFIENARYLRALESDLSKTISALEGVASARVHIAMPQTNTFADENSRPTASVVLNVGPGISSDKEKISAIIQIVASSVPGLDPKDVSVTDQYGHYLSNSMDKQSQYDAEQLAYQNNLQSYYEKRIESLIAPIVGQNKVNVRVYADIDFSLQETAKEEYDPNQKVIRSEQEESESAGGAGGASGTPGALSPTAPSSGSDKSGAAGGGSGKSQSVRNYELGKSVSYKKSNFAKLNSLSVAVVVDNQTHVDAKTGKSITLPVDKDQMSKLTDLVKATIGFDDHRGDRVTVINSSFTPPVVETPPAPLPMWQEPWFWDWTKKILGIILGFIVIFFIHGQIARFAKLSAPAPVPVKAKRPDLGVEAETEDSGSLPADMQHMKQEQIKRLKEMANRDPERIALVIKSWIGN
jgi:flagellar M-ring protein FliF